MSHCLIKPQTILVAGAKLEFFKRTLSSVMTLELDGRINFIKFSSAGDLLSITITAKDVEVDIRKLLG